ncbi:MAG: VanW family protein [Peptococcaceae bacterium]|nr:VanW family protein [Peptococcaceae bacterium]
MKRLVLIFFLMLTCLISLTNAYAQGENEPGEPTDDYGIYSKFKGMEKPYEGPLPWEGEPKFQEAIKKHNTPVRMAAYKATLPDPIMAEGYNIGLAADQLAGKVVQPGEIFSQNEAIGPYTRQRGYQAGPTYAGNQIVTTVGGGVCKIATMLYNVVVFSDLQVVMRSAHSMTVPYVPPGQDATVYYGVRDFRFLNNTEGPVVIWSRKVDDTLYMALYGCRKPPKITWQHRILKRFEYWTVHRYNPSLPPGTEKVAAPGQDGYIVKSWVTVEKPDKTITYRKMGISYYNSSPRIVECGPKKTQ